MNSYSVFKRTGTHADTLAAIGAADVLRHLEPHLVEFEDRFEIRLRRHLKPTDLDSVDPGFSYLELIRKDQPKLPPERIVPARAQKDRLTNEGRMYSILRRMKAYGGPNKVVSRFARMDRPEWSRRIWESFDRDAEFVFSSPLVQLFNPQAGKGYAMLKPRGTNRRDKTKDRWAEPFLEWLRFRGYFEGAAGWFTGGDLRLYCLIPANIDYNRFATVAFSFRDLNLGGTAVKMDCRGVLALTRLLINNAGSYRRPAESVRELWATHYKDMGQAYTLMAMDRLAIPDWFKLRTSEDQQLWLLVLEEHDRALRRLNDTHSDEFGLLKQYRRTFQTRRDQALAEFVEFVARYGTLLFRRRARDEWSLPQLTSVGVTELFSGNSELHKLLQNPGFLAVASAVRSSTVGAQVARRNGDADHREIRYGLLSEITRAGLIGKRELAELIACFIAGFNREGVRRRLCRIRSAAIRNEELGAFASLLEGLPSSVPVGSVLCAISTCLPHATLTPELDQPPVQAIPA